MEDDIQSISQASVDLHKSRVVEYEMMHNISRPVSPINLIVSSRATNPEKGLEYSSSLQISNTQTINDDSFSQVSNGLSIRGTNKNVLQNETTKTLRRKGKPPTCNALVAVPDTIRLKNRNNDHVEDHDLLLVSSLQNRPKSSPDSSLLPTLALPNFTKQKPSKNSQLSRSLTKPALGYVEPQGELRRTQLHLFHEKKKMLRYNAGVSPLERISRIEHDLIEVMSSRKNWKVPHATGAGASSLNGNSNSAGFPFFSPTPVAAHPLSPTSSTSSNHLTIEVSLATPPQLLPGVPGEPSPAPNMTPHPDLLSPNLFAKHTSAATGSGTSMANHTQQYQLQHPTSSLLPMSSSALTVFSDIDPDIQSIGSYNSSTHPASAHSPSAPSPSLSLKKLPQHSNLTNPENYSQQKVQQTILHELTYTATATPTTNTALATNTAHTTVRSWPREAATTSQQPSSHSPFAQAMSHPMTTTSHQLQGKQQKGQGKHRDPTSYLVRDHHPESTHYQLYRLAPVPTSSPGSPEQQRDRGDPTGGAPGGEASSADAVVSFDYLKQKLLSTKDKIYDCGPEYYQKLYAETEAAGGGGAHGVGGVGVTDDNAITDRTATARATGREDDPVVTGTGITRIYSKEREMDKDKDSEKEKEKLSNATMPSRYQEGKVALVETPLDPKNSIKGYIKLREDREIELKTRIPCVSCLHEASLWCPQCHFSYCALCWNAVPHHEFVHPDEVWRNRSPRHAIEKCEHSVTGLHVHLTPEGLVSQGLVDKNNKKIIQIKTQTQTQTQRTRGIHKGRPKGRGAGGGPLSQNQSHNHSYGEDLRRSVGGGGREESRSGDGGGSGGGSENRHRLSNFPSTDSIMERGFNHAEDWADLEDERSFTSEGCAGGLSLTGLQKAEKSDMKITLPLSLEKERTGEGQGQGLRDEEMTAAAAGGTGGAGGGTGGGHQEITDENSVDEGEGATSAAEGQGEDGTGEGAGEVGEKAQLETPPLPMRQQQQPQPQASQQTSSNSFLFSFDPTQQQQQPHIPQSHSRHLSASASAATLGSQLNRSYLPPRQQSPPGRYGREVSERAKSPPNLMWQATVAATGSPQQRGRAGGGGGTLTAVSRTKASPQMKQMKGITYQFATPQEWDGGRGRGREMTTGIGTMTRVGERAQESQLEFTIHRGVSVATIRR